jgi:hypothetical protein
VPCLFLRSPSIHIQWFHHSQCYTVTAKILLMLKTICGQMVMILSWTNAVRVTLHFNRYISFHNHKTLTRTRLQSCQELLTVTCNCETLRAYHTTLSQIERNACQGWLHNHKRVLISSNHMEYCICTVYSGQGLYLQTAMNTSDSETVIDHATVSAYIVAKMSVHDRIHYSAVAMPHK